MSVRFNRFICCALVLILQCVLLPIYSIAVVEMPLEHSELKSISVEEPDLSDPSVKKIAPRTVDRLLEPIPVETIVEPRQDAAAFDWSERPGLARLANASEISVLADVDAQFERNMAEYQLVEEDSAVQVDEATLFDSVHSGRMYNRESLAALARTEQAKAQTGQTLALLLPSASVRANRGYERSEPSVVVDDVTGELIASDTHIRTDVVLTVTQPLFNLPSLLDWRRSKAKEAASEASYRVSDGDAYVATINAYLALVSSRLQVDVARDFEVQLAELLKYIEKRAGAGASSISDMSRVQARREAILSSRLALESAHRAAGTEFVRLTNLVPQMVRIPVFEDVGASVLPISFDTAVATAMRLNPEIAALTAELAAEKIGMSAAGGRFLPRIDAEYTDTYSLHAGGSATSQRDRRGMVVLNWNLFNGGKDINFYRERNARYVELQYRLDDQRRRVAQALSSNYAALESAGERIDSGYLEMKSISTAAEAMSKRMLSGNQSLLDLLDVYNQRYLVRSRLVDLHVVELNTVAQLVRLTHGTPWAVPKRIPLLPERDKNPSSPTDSDSDLYLYGGG